MKKIHVGDLTVESGKVYDFEEVTGYLYASGSDIRASFPKLTTVGGYLDAYGADTKASFPKLTTVGGTLYAYGADTKASFPKLTTVGGNLYAHGADTKASFPKLTTVGGTLYAYGADTRASFPKLTTIGGKLYANGAGTRASFPKLTTIGLSLDAHGAEFSAPKLKTTNDRQAYIAAMNRKGFDVSDGVLSKIIKRRRGGLLEVLVVGQTKPSFVVKSGEHTAHGETLIEAKADLDFKINGRDASRFKSWKLDEKRPIGEMIVAYRAITGACAKGVRDFVKKVPNLPKRIAPKEVMVLVKGSYGEEEFREFLNRLRRRRERET